MADRDRLLAAVARGQHSIVSTKRLRALGFGSGAVSRRVADGTWVRLHQGVYYIGSGAPTREGRWLAAVIAAGASSRLSHRSAAALHGFAVTGTSLVEVTVPHCRKPRLKGVRVHRTRSLHPDDTALFDRIPATTAERTLVDLAEVLPLDALRRALERAERMRLIDHAKLRFVAQRATGRRGAAALRELSSYDPGPAAEAKEGLEVMFYELVTAAGLPPYNRNVTVAGEEVDAYWPEANLVVELQSYRWHTDRSAFERDHEKLARLKLAGVETLALTYRQVTQQPEWVVESLGSLLKPPRVAGFPSRAG